MSATRFNFFDVVKLDCANNMDSFFIVHKKNGNKVHKIKLTAQWNMEIAILHVIAIDDNKLEVKIVKE